MAIRDLPQMSSANYTSNTRDAYTVMAEAAASANLRPQALQSVLRDAPISRVMLMQTVRDPVFTSGQWDAATAKAIFDNPEFAEEEDSPMAKAARRLVKVIIVDPNENVPLDSCVLYSGPEKMTDLDDNELFFDLDVKALLDTHNAKRVTLPNKAIKERVELLEPARIRDLKMSVVTIASF